MKALIFGVVGQLACLASSCGGQSGGLSPAPPTCEGALRDQGVVDPNVAPDGFSASFASAMKTITGTHKLTFESCGDYSCNPSGSALIGTPLATTVSVTGPVRALRLQPEPYLPPDCPMAYEAPVSVQIQTINLQTNLIGRVRVSLKAPIEVRVTAEAPLAQVETQFPADFSRVNKRHVLDPSELRASTALWFRAFTVLPDPVVATPSTTGYLEWYYGVTNEAEMIAPFKTAMP